MRFRTIFLAVRDYSGEILFPRPEYYATATANFQKSKELCFFPTPLEEVLLKRKTTVRDAIGDLPAIEGGEKRGE